MYADRTVLNPVMGELEKEFGLSGTQLGILNSVFYFSYALLQVPAGILGDKIGKKKVLVPGFILFGVFTAVTGWAKSWYTLLFARVVTGLVKEPTTVRNTVSLPSRSRRNIVLLVVRSSTVVWPLVLRWV